MKTLVLLCALLLPACAGAYDVMRAMSDSTLYDRPCRRFDPVRDQNEALAAQAAVSAIFNDSISLRNATIISNAIRTSK